MQCKYCNSDLITKNGHDSRGNQRHLCTKCDHTFSSESRKRVPFEFISFILHQYHNMSLKGKRNYFPTMVNQYLYRIDYEPVHRTTIYSWSNKYNKKDLIKKNDTAEWFFNQPRKDLPKKHRTKQKRISHKKEVYQEYPEAKLLGTHTEFLAWLKKNVGKEIFKVLEKYSPETIEELFDSFQFEKYRKNKLKIDAIVRKRENR